MIDEREQPKTLKELIEKLSLLIENDSLRRRMGVAGKKEVEKGKFSISTRNERPGRFMKKF